MGLGDAIGRSLIRERLYIGPNPGSGVGLKAIGGPYCLCGGAMKRALCVRIIEDGLHTSIVVAYPLRGIINVLSPQGYGLIMPSPLRRHGGASPTRV